ncbi:RimK/LysX family protein [Marinospirillum sp.]|uniref:ATP-dependent zinc protease family protein n=1 Tax=Marinospirillum sp. TaxID=2183934 RepID=UPI00286FBF28|nr:RimK/LysX family protein [Marinospirillum sp.]MDR9467522.1 RimK/LysX family protein [Marinospirillum sp.]
MNPEEASKIPVWLQNRLVIGAKEVVSFPDLNLTVKAKVDTGAKTSSLHAYEITTELRGNQQWVSFTTASEDPDEGKPIRVSQPVYDKRLIRSSNGEESQRYVIRLWMQLGPVKQRIEVTLADRSKMKYPMLLGRVALEERFLVAPGASYLLGATESQHQT